MYTNFQPHLQKELSAIREAGLYKEERAILTPQSAGIRVSFPIGSAPREVINFCANNYLGLSSHPKVIAAARAALESHGFGLSSVRFICGTQDIHKQLERRISEFLGTEDAILYTSCFDANGGLFETLLGENDVIITDQLNHASIIDGIRLCKAKRLIYANADMTDLEAKLKEAKAARFRMIATDGAFSMDGSIAPIDRICDLADRYDALVMVDDSHCTGFLGKTGRGSAEHCGAEGRVDIITSTLGKALGGASGGFTTGRKEIIDLLRQRSRPYLFSNTLAPMIVQASIAVLDLLSETTALRDKLEANTKRFRAGMTAAGFDIKPGVHPIVPIMLYNAKLAQDVARDLYGEGVYVIGFFFPVVGRGLARIRVQLSAAHEFSHIDRAIEAFTRVGRKYEILGKKREEIVARYGE
ncbi:MAG: glycine C-acetyltransferase [Phycisphaerae bacterium]|nr:MAG: glycine C-acetyltransferase [Planctomycetota bacterium]KAB2940246.1 MAG: glycine C-acetyltransferase [Phycisphaerae bacterium]MBE7458266.1 glycine C-acetyltransferase [Planctomycetia bacterium]MCK6466097.1 glycine C-acetyltransferase [Phycisphaerae bacterium]MCL4718698.1 glycine C-acetyltransferase [Phycisphaerae bacterium]